MVVDELSQCDLPIKQGKATEGMSLDTKEHAAKRSAESVKQESDEAQLVDIVPAEASPSATKTPVKPTAADGDKEVEPAEGENIRDSGREERSSKATPSEPGDSMAKAKSRRPIQLAVPQIGDSESGAKLETRAKEGTSGSPLKNSMAETPTNSSLHTPSSATSDGAHDLHNYFDHPTLHAKPSHWMKVRDSVHGIAAFKLAARRGNRRKLAVRAVLVVVLGCIAVVPYEFLLKADAHATRITNMANYLFAIASSLATGGSGLLFRRRIPLSSLAGIVVANYGFNQLSAVAFALGLSLPLALVIKNGGILCQMIAGSLVARSRYSWTQTVLASCATLGIIITVLASLKKKEGGAAAEEGGRELWVVGAGCMAAAMMSRALATVWVQQTYAAHGRHYDEVLLYQHALGLPLLLWEGPALYRQLVEWSAAPWLFGYLAVLVGANFAVTKACGQLVGISSPVVLNVVLVFQRFLSILASALYFNAPPYPPPLMWAGSLLVVLGCAGYVLAPGPKPSKPKGE